MNCLQGPGHTEDVCEAGTCSPAWPEPQQHFHFHRPTPSPPNTPIMPSSSSYHQKNVMHLVKPVITSRKTTPTDLSHYFVHRVYHHSLLLLHKHTPYLHRYGTELHWCSSDWSGCLRLQPASLSPPQPDRYIHSFEFLPWVILSVSIKTMSYVRAPGAYSVYFYCIHNTFWILWWGLCLQRWSCK